MKEVKYMLKKYVVGFYANTGDHTRFQISSTFEDKHQAVCYKNELKSQEIHGSMLTSQLHQYIVAEYDGEKIKIKVRSYDKWYLNAKRVDRTTDQFIDGKFIEYPLEWVA